MLGVGFGVAVAVGNAIGAGIFRAPGEVAGHLSSQTLVLIAWTAGGLYALLGAIQIAELATMLPRSGGQYVFSRHALGEYAGFVVGWSDWISTCGSTAAVTIVTAEFTAALVPSLSGRVPAVAAAVAVAFALVQWRGVRESSVVQNVTSAMKGLAFAALIVGAFTRDAAARPDTAVIVTAPSTGIAVAFLLALQSVVYTYDGWTGVVYFSEEVRNPARDIPRSLFAGVASIIAIYLLVNLAILHVLPMSTLAGDPFAAGTVVNALLGDGGAVTLRILTIVSMLSAVNAFHLMASRVLLAMSRDGLVSRRLAVVNRGGTPVAALLLSTVVAIVFIVFGRTFERVITVLAFFFIANYTLSFTSLVVMRVREPERPRPYRAWGYPWTTGIALAGSVAFLIGAIFADTTNSVTAVLVLVASYPLFRWLRARRREERATIPAS